VHGDRCPVGAVALLDASAPIAEAITTATVVATPAVVAAHPFAITVTP
jgi:hypothetical protein